MTVPETVDSHPAVDTTKIVEFVAHKKRYRYVSHELESQFNHLILLKVPLSCHLFGHFHIWSSPVEKQRRAETNDSGLAIDFLSSHKLM